MRAFNMAIRIGDPPDSSLITRRLALARLVLCASPAYLDRTRKMPRCQTMGRWGRALGPEVIKQIHERIVQIAQEKGVLEGRRMRVDTTVAETNIHRPTAAFW